ncbi:MAG: WD40 repeat domain-containing protein [Candidatus Limnocylindria bacterium]
MRRTAFAAFFLLLFLASCAVEGPRALGPSPSPSAVALPQPIVQPITRTSPAAQVAWFWTFETDRKRSLVGIDPTGTPVARFDEAALVPTIGFWRSADGASIYLATLDKITAYSALDGKLQRSYAKIPGVVVSAAFSPDGQWLAMLTTGPESRVEVIDLRTGQSQSRPAAHDPNAKLPGLSGQIAHVVWGTLVFADPTQLYLLMDWGGPARLTSFSLSNGTLNQIATAVDGQDGRRFANCAGPAVAAKVVGDGRTLVVFCHYDGAVSFFDLTTLTSLAVVQTGQKNPFWLSPIFTPDGQLLYLHNPPAFGDAMQVIDLKTRTLLGPVPTPTKVGDPGPFSWLMPIAYAGGTASTVPISPDGLKLYSDTSDGVTVMRIPDLKPIAKLAPGTPVGEIWISGDGRTVFASAHGRKEIHVVREDGSGMKSVTLTGDIGGFIASERG